MEPTNINHPDSKGAVLGNMSRRLFVAGMAESALFTSTSVGATCPVDPLTVCNITQLYSVSVARVVEVRDAEDVRQALRSWGGKVSIGGGRFSMGGQTAVTGGMQIDMRSMQNLIYLDLANKVVRVQAGMRWRSLQSLIDKHGLAVQTMQSYANFTVGGAVSVNCHGRYVGHGPIVNSVRALQMVMPNGEVLETGPERNATIFYAAIGGYGGVGVITEVELALDDNYPIEKGTTYVPLADYPSWFRQTIVADPTVLLHNADLVAPDFDQPHCVTWRRSQKPLTGTARLRPTQASYLKEQAAIFAMTELPGGESLRRKLVQPLQDSPAVVWRNFEASRDVAELEPVGRWSSTYVLQEYFIAEQHFVKFAEHLGGLIKRMPMGTLNVSIRHSPADTSTWMNWAQGNVFSFVLYYKQGTSSSVQSTVGEWTRTLIALALKFDGSYYLPYQLHATPQQFSAAYPKAGEFRKLRRELSANRFSNALWERYGV